MQVDLSGEVDFSGSQVLGSPHPLSNVIKAEDNELFVESDCDEQLVITVKFQSTVKINSVKLFTPDDGMHSIYSITETKRNLSLLFLSDCT